MAAAQAEIETFIDNIVQRDPHHSHFHHVITELVTSIMPWYLEHKHYQQAKILERITEPDRNISFRVSWERDDGAIEVCRGWRVQFCNAIGPYKGGVRFHSTVNEDILKFLGFEQIFKNSLTGLPMGGAKGGANFNPKGKSEREIMRFCQSFMTELHRYIGEDIDIPAGDIGVGAREISYLFGQYTRLENRWAGVITGKGCSFGGSAVRVEATGYGCIYFCEHVLHQINEKLDGKKIIISGSGNVALYAAEKALEKKAKIITMSDSSGFIYAPSGLTTEQLHHIIRLKEDERGRIHEVAEHFKDIEFHENLKPWGVEADIAIPCATQNEINEEDAKTLVKNNIKIICEGANMPTTTAATEVFRQNNIIHIPGKASNAGGVAVSGLEQSQNALRMGWSKEKVDQKLKSIMKDIHETCLEYGKKGDHIDYFKGANIAGFKKVADTLLAYGVV